VLLGPLVAFPQTFSVFEFGANEALLFTFEEVCSLSHGSSKTPVQSSYRFLHVDCLFALALYSSLAWYLAETFFSINVVFS
jgi:hypothetical protein